MSEEHKRYLAELIGTAVLVLVGCGAAAIGTHATGATAVNVIGIAFAFGLAVTGMAYAIGPVSGAHINPAVTVAMLAAGRMRVRDAIGYIVAQLIGGIVGAGLLVLVLKGKVGGYDLAALGLGQNGWGEGYLGQYGLGAAILTEFLATFIFTFVILGATNPTADPDARRGRRGLAVPQICTLTAAAGPGGDREPDGVRRVAPRGGRAGMP